MLRFAQHDSCCVFWSLLEHFGPPQVVNVHDTFKFLLRIYDQKRRDPVLLHDIEGSRRELLTANRGWPPCHTLGRRKAQRPVPLALEEAP